ncbi:ferredoxin [Sphingomonas sp.]|uniref:ferredoxin n=1 Tax=Sphingomonas sp. TaxID=28214 RepID=UPI003D6CE2CC
MVSTASPDPFYVEAECCLLCGVPEHIAPELFHTGEHHCSFIRQPHTSSEIDKTVEAMASSEVDCIRYRGDNDVILRRLGEAGLADLVDGAKAAGYSELRRDRVRFRPPGLSADGMSAKSLASAFRQYLRGQSDFSGVNRYKVMPATLWPRTVTLSWFEWNFHSVIFEASLINELRVISLKPAFPDALKGLARILDDWLRAAQKYQEIEWLTAAQLSLGGKGFHSPY